MQAGEPRRIVDATLAANAVVRGEDLVILARVSGEMTMLRRKLHDGMGLLTFFGAVLWMCSVNSLASLRLALPLTALDPKYRKSDSVTEATSPLNKDINPGTFLQSHGPQFAHCSSPKGGDTRGTTHGGSRMTCVTRDAPMLGPSSKGTNWAALHPVPTTTTFLSRRSTS